MNYKHSNKITNTSEEFDQELIPATYKEELEKFIEHTKEIEYLNKQVDELCGCTGKEKTRSNRILEKYHEPWCFYYMYLSDHNR